jgi:hypothetical protein
MSKDEYVQKMRELVKLSNWDKGDPEISHTEGNKLLCRALRELGWGELADEFEKMDRWYA